MKSSSSVEAESVPSSTALSMVNDNNTTSQKCGEGGGVFFFERISSSQQQHGSDSKSTAINSPSPVQSATMDDNKNNGGGVFYFERISRSSFSSQLDHLSPNVSDSSSNLDDNDEDDDEDGMLFETIVNDCGGVGVGENNVNDDHDNSLFGSFDDLMDMDVNIELNNNDDDTTSNSDTKLAAVTSSALVIEGSDDDIVDEHNHHDVDMMMDDDYYSFDDDVENGIGNSITTDSGSVSSTGSPNSTLVPPETLSYHNSPTSVAAVTSSAGCVSSLSHKSASTRPALTEMRKIMNQFMNDESSVPPYLSTTDDHQGTHPLPCARGMDNMYMDTLHKLQERMRRSEQTRAYLSMHIHNSGNGGNVSNVIRSVQSSSLQVDTCLQSVIYQQQQNHRLAAAAAAAATQ